MVLWAELERPFPSDNYKNMPLDFFLFNILKKIFDLPGIYFGAECNIGI